MAEIKLTQYGRQTNLQNDIATEKRVSTVHTGTNFKIVLKWTIYEDWTLKYAN